MNQPQREAYVAALLAGELSLDDPQVQARLRAEPELRTMLERMREVEAAVARAAGEQREVLAAARGPADAELAGRVAAGVRQMVVERQRVRRRKWLAAAAVLIAGLALGGFLLLRTPAAPGDMLLGSDDGLSPHGAIDRSSYSPFTWDMPPQPGVRFVLRIYEVVGGRKGRLLYPKVPETVTSPWNLPSDFETTLPDEVYWEVEVLGGDQPELHGAHVWRRR